MLLWSGVGGQLSQPFSADLLSHHVAVVRGWWSAFGGQLLSYHLLWSGVGGQLLSYHVGGLYCMSSLEGPFRGAFGKRIRSRETIKGDRVFKFPLFEEIHFDSFQKPWFSFAGQTDESWWYFPQLSCSVWERWHSNNCRRTLIQVYSVEPWRSSAVRFIDQSHFTAASVV